MLELTGLRKRYDETVALDGLDLQAQPGRILGFLGPNGAGKTTAMRAVFGLVRLDAGRVAWRGRPVDADTRLRFGYMPEQRGLYPRMRIGDQLAYFGELHGMDRATAQRAASEWLGLLGLGDRAGDRLDALSHGNQQRVQLACALVHRPDALILDEPFNGLDPLAVDRMVEALRREVERGVVVVFSSHQLDLVEELCQDVVIISQGRQVLSGTLEQVRFGAGHRRVDLGLADGGVDRLILPPDVEVVDRRPDGLRLRVPATRDPQSLLTEIRSEVPVTRFSYEPPHLSELFREAVA